MNRDERILVLEHAQELEYIQALIDEYSNFGVYRSMRFAHELLVQMLVAKDP